MPTTNEELFDAFVRHQIGLLRVNAGITKEVMSILNQSEAAVRGELGERLGNILLGGNYNKTAARRLESLEKALQRIRAGVYGEIDALLRRQYTEMVAAEALFVKSTVEALVPVVLTMTMPTSFTLNALLEKPFQGRVLNAWSKYLSDRDMERIMARVRIGMVQGHSASQIVQGILGTKRLRGVDGLTQASRRELTDITRTATNFFGNQARRLAFLVNEDVFEFEQYVATLDSRTTIVCMSLDGRRYKIGDGPYPPIHVNCRSIRVALVSDELIGRRPFNSTAKRQLLREYSQQAGIATPINRNSLPRGHKGPYDIFANKRGKELIGQVPARTTYEQFLRRQSVEFQNEVLGKTKAGLYREGKVTLDRFVDVTGRQYTLAELAVRDSL